MYGNQNDSNAMDKDLNSTSHVFIGGHSLKEAGKFIYNYSPSRIFILVDENTRIFCLPVLLYHLRFLESAFIIEIRQGEKEKKFETIQKIISELVLENADRKSLLINLGGGVLGDIGGFVASIYKRGIGFINVPTTLLAMVDASVGGKNGINFLNIKNVIGTFTKPNGVFIYPLFLETLPESEIRSGYGEIIKHVLLSDANRWSEMMNFGIDIKAINELEGLISHSVKFKSEITDSDFKESGRRKELNFGHTIGHALESTSLKSGHELKHGEAISAGIVAELYLSHYMAGFPEKILRSASKFIRSIFHDIHLSGSNGEILIVMKSDKKNSLDKIGFSLLKAPGIPAGLFFPSEQLILDCLDFMYEEFDVERVNDND